MIRASGARAQTIPGMNIGFPADGFVTNTFIASPMPDPIAVDQKLTFLGYSTLMAK